MATDGEAPPPPAVGKEWVLGEHTEYRFEIDPGSSIAIKLVKGKAEVFGAELAINKIYIFGFECKAAVYTWSGCTLEVFGHPSSEYTSDETPMNTYANLALLFEQMRLRAYRLSREKDEPSSSSDPSVPPVEPPTPGIPEGPPRILVIGPESSGKTTACKILVNYGVRSEADWSPMLVNLDTGDGGYTVPGTISAAPIDTPIMTFSAANPLGVTASSAPTTLSSSALLPLVYWFGHLELRKKVMLMERLIRNLGDNVIERGQQDPKWDAAGIIVDTPAGFAAAPADDKYKLLKAAKEAFRINVILVIGHEKLNVEMQKLFGTDGKDVLIMKIPKSGGVVEVDQIYRDRITHLQMRTYMYGFKLPVLPGLAVLELGGEGLPDMSLAPHSTVLGFDDLKIIRIGEENMAPQSALPIGAQRVISETQPVTIDPSQPGSGLLNAVLALLSPTSADEGEKYDEEVLDLDTVGFLVVTSIDIPNRKMTILAPSSGGITGRSAALLGTIEWQEL